MHSEINKFMHFRKYLFFFYCLTANIYSLDYLYFSLFDCY